MPLKKVNFSKKSRYSQIATIITYIVMVLIIITAGAKLYLLNWKSNHLIDEEKYQIVFLDNGESYFGKLEYLGFKTYRLTDVYYLKYFPKTQQINSEENTNENYELKLIKLGEQEFYKPVNTIIINKDKIIYWENLQSDSEVMKIINQ